MGGKAKYAETQSIYDKVKIDGAYVGAAVELPVKKEDANADATTVEKLLKTIPTLQDPDARELYGALKVVGKSIPVGHHESVTIDAMAKEIEESCPSEDTKQNLLDHLDAKTKAVNASLRKLDTPHLLTMRKDIPVLEDQSNLLRALEQLSETELLQFKGFSELLTEEIRYHSMKRKIFNEELNEIEECMMEAIGSLNRDRDVECRQPKKYTIIRYPSNRDRIAVPSDRSAHDQH
jgi:hypothetical protein